jgi:hypothetical protein
MLAPLFDKMTTRDVPQRLTAAEALEFFEDFLPEISTTTLREAYLAELLGGQPYDVFDRWKNFSLLSLLKNGDTIENRRFPSGLGTFL